MSRSDLQAIAEMVSATKLQDTHEHLPSEQSRVIHKEKGLLDFSYLFSHYIDSDLLSAGLSQADLELFFSNSLDPIEKWDVVEPYYKSIKNTGYGLCLRKSLSTLYGVEELTRDSLSTVTSLMNQQTEPGFYSRILRELCQIEHVQVNCLESAVIRTEEEDRSLISQDLNTLRIASQWDLSVIEAQSNISVNSIKSIHEAISQLFERHGSNAIAVKDPSAYWRRLLFDDVSDSDADVILQRYLLDSESISNDDYQAVGSNLFRHAVREATNRNIPIKIHTGYLAGANHMDLSKVTRNLIDLQSLIKDFPDARFVLMHISYPMQSELLALAKHYSNVFVDMCWSWIVNPLAASDFLEQFLVSAPSNKIFTFGGDFIPVELITGHSQMAREGIARALSSLCDADFFSRSEVLKLIPQIMADNAADFFKVPRAN